MRVEKSLAVEATRIRLLQGRLFDERDTAASPLVVIIGQSLAARLWPGQNPIGRRLFAYGAPEPEHGKPLVWQTVVGVVEDARYREVKTPRFDLYLPYRQAPNQVQHFMVRLSGDPLAAVPALRSAVAALGAQRRDIVVLVAGEGAWVALKDSPSACSPRGS